MFLLSDFMCFNFDMLFAQIDVNIGTRDQSEKQLLQHNCSFKDHPETEEEVSMLKAASKREREGEEDWSMYRYLLNSVKIPCKSEAVPVHCMASC